MGQNGWDKIKNVLKSWELGDYFRQFSIVAAGIIVTFWGSDKNWSIIRRNCVK